MNIEEQSIAEQATEIQEKDSTVESKTNERLDLYVEALIFAAEYALNTEEIRRIVNVTFDQSFKKQHIQELIDNVRDKYNYKKIKY